MKILRNLAFLTVMVLSGWMEHSFAGVINRQQHADTMITVPLGGNAWRTGKDTTGGRITNDGIVEWTNRDNDFTAYVRIAKPGKLKIWLNLKVNGANEKTSVNKLSVSALKETRQIMVAGFAFKDNYAGEWTVTDTGYVAIKITGLTRMGPRFADIASIKLAGSAINDRTAFVKNNDGDFFYWGRRGPSVHLGYLVPAKTDVEWFYNEVTVPEGNDVVGSYFMADGFNEGYFGMQVNSPTERHILFSVWSPYKTDNPGQIPADQKITMLKKGTEVHTGEFGNEGSGGQSYLLYNWKAGQTYKFLIRAKPDGNNHTVYTAWFFSPDFNRWQLIASFSRPQTNTYLKHLHSFLENFEPEQGTITRKVFFNNEWVADSNGKWTELKIAKFTVDNTGAKGYRMDYEGGVANGVFYLKNCGFFNNYTIKNGLFERAATGKAPEIDLGALK